MTSLHALAATDTITAIATARGIGGVGVIRVSGPHLSPLAKALTQKDPMPRQAMLASFLAEDGQPIDRGLLLYFPAPASYTGEDVLEIQAHGGPVIMDMLLSRIIAIGARPAEAGEFTRRAFLNGKIDLVQAESVIDLISAATQTAARAATLSLSGVFSKKIDHLSELLITTRMHLEAAIDFSDEEIDYLDVTAVKNNITTLIEKTNDILKTAKQGAILRQGIRIALVGRPNVGKSSLLNCLLGEDRAIVSDIAGTTRDTLAETLSIEGIPVTLIDTAGLRETDHPIEQMGIQRSWTEIERADLIVWIVDGDTVSSHEDQDIINKCPTSIQKLIVHNKIDLLNQQPSSEQTNDAIDIYCSAKTGAGIDLLKQALLSQIGWTSDTETPFVARERHLFALTQAKSSFKNALACFDSVELAAEELRLAHQSLGEITGQFSTEDLLGEIFSRFCIGK